MNQLSFNEVFEKLHELYSELTKINNNIKILEVREEPPETGGPRLPHFYRCKSQVTGSIQEILLDLKDNKTGVVDDSPKT